MKKFSFLENNINNSKSLITSFTRLFISMLVILGITTGISALKEVKREVYTCLDEKFSLILYSTSEILEKKEDIDSLKIQSIFNSYIIGDSGFCAILNTAKEDNTKVEFLTKGAPSSMEELERTVNSNKFEKYFKQAYRPSEFMDIDFPNKQIDLKIDSNYYRVRVCDTNIDDIYILVGSGHDQYFFKILRIVLDAMVLTIIAVPITILITKRAFKILAGQIMTLEKTISSLKNNLGSSIHDNKLYESKNEIGHLAKSINDLAVSLDKKSKIDELTQVYNRRKFNEDMRCIGEVLNKDIPVSILFIDIDFFKRYNDYHGHVAGDVVLKRVANIVYETNKDNENISVYRYGGEEFAVICTDCDKESSINVANDIIAHVKEANIIHSDSPIANRVTLSLGVATGTLDSTSMDDILMNSDKAVYNSKETGRNKYTHYSELNL